MGLFSSLLFLVLMLCEKAVDSTVGCSNLFMEEQAKQTKKEQADERREKKESLGTTHNYQVLV